MGQSHPGVFQQAELFVDCLRDALWYRLSAHRQSTELQVMLFPDGLDQLPHLSSSGMQAIGLNDLAVSVSLSGQLAQSVALFRRCIEIDVKDNGPENVSGALCNLSNVLRFTGALHESELVARRALIIDRQLRDKDSEADSLCTLGDNTGSTGKRCGERESTRSILRISTSG